MASHDPFRAFVAIELPEPTKLALGRLASALRGADGTGAVRWVRPDGIHLTLTFLGDIRAAQAVDVAATLRHAVAGHAPFALRLGRLGAFPDGPGWRRHRVIWVGLDGDLADLSSLQRDVTASLAPLGFPPDQHAFTPHLTLGRVAAGRRRATFTWPADGEEAPLDDALFRVGGVSLMESELMPGGARYTQRSFVPLG